jgi:replicative DNA helicase
MIFADYEPPADLELAEQCVAGYAISTRQAAEEVGEVIRPRDFLRPAHGVILGTALRLAANGVEVDPVAVLSELVKTGEIAALGGRGDYLHTVYAAGLHLGPSWALHAKRVREERQRFDYIRELQHAAQESLEAGFEFEVSLERVRDRLDAIACPDEDAPVKSMRDLVREVIDGLEHEEDRGLESPWADLTYALGGIVPGQVTIVGARPSVGKSLVACQWGAHIASTLGKPVLFASMEMTAPEVTMRLISAASRVPLINMVRRQMEDDDWDRLAKYAGDVSDSPLVIDDQANQSLARIRSRLRSMAHSDAGAAVLLVVDYLALLALPDGSENRQVGVAALSRGLKLIAREFMIPVMVVAQVRRESEKRQGQRPTMSDLRESGQIEADADVILLLHRDDMYEPESPRAGEIDVIIEKNRQGPKTTVTLAFQGHYGRVVGMAPEDCAQPAAAADDAAAADNWDPSSRWAS